MTIDWSLTKPFDEEEFGPREIVPGSLKLTVQSTYYLKGKTRILLEILGPPLARFLVGGPSDQL